MTWKLVHPDSLPGHSLRKCRFSQLPVSPFCMHALLSDPGACHWFTAAQTSNFCLPPFQQRRLPQYEIFVALSHSLHTRLLPAPRLGYLTRVGALLARRRALARWGSSPHWVIKTSFACAPLVTGFVGAMEIFLPTLPITFILPIT